MFLGFDRPVHVEQNTSLLKAGHSSIGGVRRGNRRKAFDGVLGPLSSRLPLGQREENVESIGRTTMFEFKVLAQKLVLFG